MILSYSTFHLITIYGSTSSEVDLVYWFTGSMHCHLSQAFKIIKIINLCNNNPIVTIIKSNSYPN